MDQVQFQSPPWNEVAFNDRFAMVQYWLEGSSGKRILHAGCGAGCDSSQFTKFGTLVGTDAALEKVARAQERYPQSKFVAGDIMDVSFDEKFDVIICLDALHQTHEPRDLVVRLASHLAPGGELILATPHRPVIERHLSAPPAPHQVRKWYTRSELRAIIAPALKIREMRTVTPFGHTGLLRFVNSYRLADLMGRTFGDRLWKAFRERLGFGWTLMVRATLCWYGAIVELQPAVTLAL